MKDVLFFRNFYIFEERRLKLSASIGELIRIRREQLNMTQEQLAEKIEKDVTTVSAYERGKAKLNSDKLVVLADVLKVPVGYFFGEVSGKSSNDEKELLITFRSMDRDMQKRALAVIKCLSA